MSNRRPENRELVHWLATDPVRLAETLDQHRPDGESCRCCHRLWPCGMYRHARAALLEPFTLHQQARRAAGLAPSGSRCWCGGVLQPPTRIRFWLPDPSTAGPGPGVYGVVHFGQWPHRRRYERHLRAAGEYWLESGPDARRAGTPLRWTDVGRCPAGAVHPVVAAWQDDDGDWLLDLTPPR